MFEQACAHAPRRTPSDGPPSRRRRPRQQEWRRRSDDRTPPLARRAMRYATASASTSSSTISALSSLVPSASASSLTEDLPGLRQHALLAGRQAAVLVAPPQVTHDLGDLVDVARGELLAVGLVAPRPVRRLLGVRRAQHLEHPVETLLADDVTNADDLGVVSGYQNGQIALRDLQNQVGLLLALDRALLDCFDLGRPVMGVNHGLADLKRHVCGPLSTSSRVTRPRSPRIEECGLCADDHAPSTGRLRPSDIRCDGPRRARRGPLLRTVLDRYAELRSPFAQRSSARPARTATARESPRTDREESRT